MTMVVAAVAVDGTAKDARESEILFYDAMIPKIEVTFDRTGATPKSLNTRIYPSELAAIIGCGDYMELCYRQR